MPGAEPVLTVLASNLDSGSAAFARNREEMAALLAEARGALERVRAHSERARATFEKRGALLPRDRLALLLDRDRPFIEVAPLAGLGMHDDDGDRTASGGGSIAGIGFVAGTRCLVFAHDSGIKGGATSPMGLRKKLRVHEIAHREKLPFVALAESAGANLRYQAEMFVEGGAVFASQARMSAAGIPQVTVVHGSSTAGGAYLPGLSDYVVAVRKRATIFLAGPPLLRAATGEIAKAEDLGGADMHATRSGLVEHLAEDDRDGIRIAREIVAALDWDRHAPPAPTRRVREPLYPPEELLGAVPVDYRQPYDVREVLARIVDASEFLDFKPGYGPTTVCGHAEIGGHRVDIVGNNGPIFAEGAAKAAQFIQLCCQSGTPLLYLMNTTGYIVGRAAEEAGIIKHGSKMLQAIANATVPQLTLVIGGGFGAGYYGMCGRCFDPRFIFAWPNARVAVMGGEQAGKVLRIIGTEAAERQGKAPDEERLAALERETAAQFARESTALYATARLWDDGIIDPRDTRWLLIELLDVVATADRRVPRRNSFGVGRM